MEEKYKSYNGARAHTHTRGKENLVYSKHEVLHIMAISLAKGIENCFLKNHRRGYW